MVRQQFPHQECTMKCLTNGVTNWMWTIHYVVKGLKHDLKHVFEYCDVSSRSLENRSMLVMGTIISREQGQISPHIPVLKRMFNSFSYWNHCLAWNSERGIDDRRTTWEINMSIFTSSSTYLSLLCAFKSESETPQRNNKGNPILKIEKSLYHAITKGRWKQSKTKPFFPHTLQKYSKNLVT